MTLPRRRLVRPVQAPVLAHPATDRQLQKLRSRLETERLSLSRWMSRLRRAFHAVEKSQVKITRIERQLAHLEE